MLSGGALLGVHTRLWAPPTASEVPTIVKCTETQISIVVAGSRERKKGKSFCDGYRVSVL